MQPLPHTRKVTAEDPYFWTSGVLFLLGGVLFLAGIGGHSASLLIIGSLLCLSAFVLAPRHRASEDVRVISVVVPELESAMYSGMYLAADFVEGADNTAFKDRPETFNRLRVDRANNYW